MRLFDQLEPANRAWVLSACLSAALCIAVVDVWLAGRVSFGILYMVPLLVSASFLERWQIILLAIAAALLREQFGPHSWGQGAVARVPAAFVAFAASGLFLAEMVRRRFEVLKSEARQASLRRQAEAEAVNLIESSPAAVVTVNPDGSIDLANRAARLLLGLEDGKRVQIGEYLPPLAEVLKSRRGVSLLHTMVEGGGRRSDGETFFAHMWVSSYPTTAGTKMAVVFADVSEQLRDREELGLRQLLTSSKIIVGAVSHEIRNLAAAADALHERLGQSPELRAVEDFESLGRVIEAMRKLASAEVPGADQALAGVDVKSVLRELRVILAAPGAPGPEIHWQITEDLPAVRADRSGLLQVFLNLAQNSLRALEGQADGRLVVAGYQLGASVVVRFSDNGPGIASSEGLFQPFQRHATSTGLGLYVSRAMIRTYGGELQYMKTAGEGCFLVELPAITAIKAGAHD